MVRIKKLLANFINRSFNPSPPNSTSSDSIAQEKEDSADNAILFHPCTSISDWISIEKEDYFTSKPILSSSPYLVLPQKEATVLNQESQFQPQTFMGFCLFDLVNKNFLPANWLHKKHKDEEMLKLEDLDCFGSSHGWLALFNHNTSLAFLMNPLTFELIPLPPLETLPGFSSPDEFSGQIVLSSTPDTVDCTLECGVMMIPHGAKSGLAFCRVGDISWFSLVSEDVYEDVVYSKKNKKFYCLYCDLEDVVQFHVWDPDSRKIPEKIAVVEFSHGFPDLKGLKYDSRLYYCSCAYLVESSEGELLLVEKFVANHVGKHSDEVVKSLRFDVYKVDEMERRLNYVHSLGDQALFLGANHAFSVKASDFHGIKASCMYFSDESRGLHDLLLLEEKGRSNLVNNFGYMGHDFGVYNLEDKSISPCYESKTKNFSHVPLWLEPHRS